MKYSFLNDYSEGAHERILQALSDTNRLQTPGYGSDDFCRRAADAVRRAAQCEGSVHFIAGGTLTNLIVASALLRPHQGMIAAHTGHVNVHETGAIEATGHKVIAIPSKDGKITAQQVDEVVAGHYADSTAEHIVQPGMLYISQSTELGTVYKKSELEELSAVCKKHNIPFYIDGARLGCALTCKEADFTLPDIARLCDIFYIGGTKLGALFGEALVINRPEYNRDFRYLIKQRGAMLAKGRLMGIQFETLFSDGLYFELGRHANRAAEILAEGIERLGFGFAARPATNQLFPIFPKTVIAELERDYAFEFNAGIDENSDSVRLCTSWASDLDKIREFLEDLAAAAGKIG